MSYIASTFGTDSKIPLQAGDNVITAGGNYLLAPVSNFIYEQGVFNMVFSFITCAVIFSVVFVVYKAIFRRFKDSMRYRDSKIGHTGTHTMRKIRQNDSDYRLLHSHHPKGFRG